MITPPDDDKVAVSLAFLISGGRWTWADWLGMSSEWRDACLEASLRSRGQSYYQTQDADPVEDEPPAAPPQSPGSVTTPPSLQEVVGLGRGDPAPEEEPNG